MLRKDQGRSPWGFWNCNKSCSSNQEEEEGNLLSIVNNDYCRLFIYIFLGHARRVLYFVCCLYLPSLITLRISGLLLLGNVFLKYFCFPVYHYCKIVILLIDKVLVPNDERQANLFATQLKLSTVILVESLSGYYLFISIHNVKKM